MKRLSDAALARSHPGGWTSAALLDRTLHWRDHLDEIEAALKEH